jgi:hypothetical protein
VYTSNALSVLKFYDFYTIAILEHVTGTRVLLIIVHRAPIVVDFSFGAHERLFGVANRSGRRFSQ